MCETRCNNETDSFKNECYQYTDYKDLGTVSGEANANYKDHVFTVDITEDTVVYAGTFASGISINMKAIKVSE